MSTLTNDIIPNETNARRDARKDVHLAASVRKNSTMRYPVDVVDLSVSGFRFMACANIVPGTRVWLTIPGMSGLEATVAWERGGQFGCVFDRPLHPSVFEHIARSFP